jgi:hypothetical protein
MDPALLLSKFQDGNKNKFFFSNFCVLLSVGSGSVQIIADSNLTQKLNTEQLLYPHFLLQVMADYLPCICFASIQKDKVTSQTFMISGTMIIFR